jgi:hypothetical protein
MTKIKNYPLDSNITGNDKLIGSDGDNGNITKNFKLSSLSSYFNSDLIEYINNIIGIGSTGSTLINPSIFNIPETFEYIVQADAYIINGILYNTPVNDTVTLAVSDVTNNRFDVIVVNINGTVTAVTGTPAANPTIPLIDEETQVRVTTILVEANTTEPDGVVTDLVYDENSGTPTEWNAVASGGTVNLSSAEQAESGTVSIKFTSASSGDNVIFTDTATHEGSSLSVIRFGVYLPSASNYRFSLKIPDVGGVNTTGVFFEDGQYGFNASLTGVWQIITIPASEFAGIAGITYEDIQFSNERASSTFYVDLFQTQEGLTPLVGDLPDYTLNIDGSQLQLLKDGLVHSFVTLPSGNFIPISGTTAGNPFTGDFQVFKSGVGGVTNIYNGTLGAGGAANRRIEVTNTKLSLVATQGAAVSTAIIDVNDDGEIIIRGSNALNANNPTLIFRDGNVTLTNQSSPFGAYIAQVDEDVTTKKYVDDTKNINNGYTVATLPIGTTGQTAYVTDAASISYRGAATGGGSDTALVFFDGTNWIYH